LAAAGAVELKLDSYMSFIFFPVLDTPGRPTESKAIA
jgi:hypothetical protein